MLLSFKQTSSQWVLTMILGTSNCGKEIIKGTPLTKKIKLAYYQSWNFQRKCLTMPVTYTPKDYTHIHFAFVSVTQGTFKPEIPDARTREEFEKFKKMTDVKKIISFGGWSFSSDPETAHILREAALPANRDTFTKNIVDFVNEHGLDGVDIDWEYPGVSSSPHIECATRPTDAI